MAAALLYEQLFWRMGIPVTASPMGAGDDAHAMVLAELWLEDESLLKDPDVSQIIQQVLRESPDRAKYYLSHVDPLPPEEVPHLGWPVFWWIVSMIAAILIPVALMVVAYMLTEVLPFPLTG